jgi:hypothetical protein
MIIHNTFLAPTALSIFLITESTGGKNTHDNSRGNNIRLPLTSLPDQHLFNFSSIKPLTLLAAVDELSGVDALSSNEEFCPLLEAVWVTESHLRKGCTTAGVVDDVL